MNGKQMTPPDGCGHRPRDVRAVAVLGKAIKGTAKWNGSVAFEQAPNPNHLICVLNIWSGS